MFILRRRPNESVAICNNIVVMVLIVVSLFYMSSAKADECAALVGRIVQQENAQFVKRSPSGNIYFLKHRLAHEISVDCGADSVGPMISVGFDGVPFPNEAMFLFAARLGTLLTGMGQPVLLKALHGCHREALKETQAEIAQRDLPHGMQVECQAFRRDGGASSFTFSKDLAAK
jgi:hypothetical protein